MKDGSNTDLSRQPEQIKAFRDTWELGIHSYLAYLRDRLVAARDLLTESGSIFVQISDENVHLVRSLMDEVYGSENFIGQIIFQKTGGFAPSGSIPSIGDYLLWYGKNKNLIKIRSLFVDMPEPPHDDPYYVLLEFQNGTIRRMTTDERRRRTILPDNARIFRDGPVTSEGKTNSPQDFIFRGKLYKPSSNAHWKTTVEGLSRLSKAEKLMKSGNNLGHKLYWDSFPAKTIRRF